jgi:hypothetical protein
MIQAVGNEISKKLTGTSEVSVARSVGAFLGATAAVAIVTVGVVAAPITVSLVALGAGCALRLRVGSSNS